MQEDFFFCTAADRCIRLIDGFIPMLQNRDLTCAGVLLRMQMDNCMRTYAPFIAEDRNAVVNCIIDGNPINKLKDANGKMMITVDGYTFVPDLDFMNNYAVCGYCGGIYCWDYAKQVK